MLRLDDDTKVGTLGGVSVRLASAVDLPEIHGALVASFSPYHWVLPDGELTHYLARLFDPRGNGPFGGFLVARRGGKVLGAATYDSGRQGDDTVPWGWAHLGALAVIPEARRMGIGRFLLRACAAHARAQGAWALFLRAPEFMASATALVERMNLARMPNLDLPLRSVARAPEFMASATALVERMNLARMPNLDLPLRSVAGMKARAYVLALD
jgi:GNAT superfamily N-acetyltransferase